jgi:hypothetical protein
MRRPPLDLRDGGFGATRVDANRPEETPFRRGRVEETFGEPIVRRRSKRRCEVGIRMQAPRQR